MSYSFSQAARNAGYDEDQISTFDRVTPAMWKDGVITANIARERLGAGTLTEIDGVSKDGAEFVRNIVFGADSALIEAMFPQPEVIREHVGSRSSAASTKSKGNSTTAGASPVETKEQEHAGQEVS